MTSNRQPVLIFARNAAIISVVAVVAYGSYDYLVRFGRLDPFKNFKKNISSLTANDGIRLSNVQAVHYHDGKLVAQAHVDRVRVSQDRESFDIDHVTNGMVPGQKGPISFEAAKGSWNPMANKFNINGGVHVKGTGLDLRSQNASVDSNNHVLEVPSPVHGKIGPGNFSAKGMRYDLDSGSFKGYQVEWQGKAPQAQEAPSDVTSRVWDIYGAIIKQNKGGEMEWDYGKATDGEVLIYAPKVVRNLKTDVVTASGRITYFSGKIDVVADKVIVYRKEKRAVFSGDVLMYVKPKNEQDRPPKEEVIPPVSLKDGPQLKSGTTKQEHISDEDKKRDEELRSGKSVHDYPLHVAAETITYWYEKGSRRAIIEGAPRARQDFPDGRWRQAWAKAATYDGEKEMMTVKGDSGKRDAHYKNSIGDMFDGQSFTFSTRDEQSEDDEDFSGVDAVGTFLDRSGEDNREAPKSQTPPSSPEKVGAGKPPPPPGKVRV